MNFWLSIRRAFKSLFDIKPEERSKVILLSMSFFLIIASYTLSKELKDLVFSHVVGLDYHPLAKTLSMIIFVPLIFFYSRLVDLLRRHQLLYFYVIAYAVLGLIFAYFMGHSTIGLNNTDSSPYRIFGWLFYFFIEGFSPFVIGVFWAFMNSITNPEEAKNNYPLIIAGSKVGGITACTIGLAWYYLTSFSLDFGSDVFNQQITMGVASLILMGVPVVINKLLKTSSKHELHGYEAAYLEAKQKKRQGTQSHKKESALSGMLSGLVLLFKYPYVSGIFALRFFYEVVTQVVNLDRLIFSKESAASYTGMSIYLFQQSLIVHVVSFVIVLVGTRPILKALGERRSLLFIPLVVGLSIFLYLVYPSQLTIVTAFVVARAMNFVFTTPLVETLYIPTVKAIKFKSKSWIDGFGAKIAKMSGSSFNWFNKGLPSSTQWIAKSSLFAGIIGLWFVTSYLLGNKFDQAVANGEVIGADPKEGHQDKEEALI